VTQEVCRGLAIGPYTREGPTGELDKTFLSMLQQQESSSAPSVAPDCPAPASDEPQGVGDLRHVVAARYCPSGSTGRGQVLGAAQLARLQRWADGLMAGARSNAGHCVRPAPGWPHLSLADAWGNGFTMTLECRRRIHPVVRSVDTHHRLTRPLSLEGRTLDHLLRSLAAGS
jgi:hypothetical protein